MILMMNVISIIWRINVSLMTAKAEHIGSEIYVLTLLSHKLSLGN